MGKQKGAKNHNQEMVGKQGKEEEGGGEDERREAAIASTPALQANFKPTRIGQDQLSKLQELHERRLKIKSKVHKKLKDGNSKSLGRDSKSSDHKELPTQVEDSVVPKLSYGDDSTTLSVSQVDQVACQAPKKRQKLHWGLDTKERWERKANM